ncbi:uncharacterized protein LOC143909583 [Arctopsyche grandis]|uniref:uncharacterized protein LOC143909583 n=1 Tax=Arctopsyche grandis TaxID=121162 RepID=UPI00406DA28A
MERSSANSNIRTVDSIMELLTEVSIGADGISMNYPPGNSSGAIDQYDQLEQLDYGDDSVLVDNGLEIDPKLEDVTIPKAWREGMEVKGIEDTGVAKTVFITQNLNKNYEKQELNRKFISYRLSYGKLIRESDYFCTILKRVSEDIKLTESRTNREKVIEHREIMKSKLNGVKKLIDDFISQNLVGEVAIRQDDTNNTEETQLTEYVFLGDKKPGEKLSGTERIISMNMCSDCNIEIITEDGQDFDAAMLVHGQTEIHKASRPEPPPPRKSAVLNAMENVDSKSLENLKKSPIVKLNRITTSLIDDSMHCEVCDYNFPSHTQEIFKHMAENNHKEKLNTYNIESQKSIIEKNPDVFGEEGQFQLNSIHINLNKIFVDPSIKQAYCGLCCRQLPFSQSNIDEHIASLKHDKLLIEAVDNFSSDFIALGIDPNILSAIKAKSGEPIEAARENKPKREMPMREMPMREMPMREPREAPMQQKQDSQVFLDVADIQNFRKVLPDKPIRCIPELYDSNNVPIHNLEYYEQPELKKFLIDNGLQRQPGGKFKCVYCPNLEIPNSRYAFRHINKHKMGPGNPQSFENWKRQPNSRQQQYNSEQKFGRVVMHKNGVNYWCTSCRLPLIDASTAFAHVKTDNHYMYVDGVSFSSGTIFDCSTCKTTINGEKNACQHLIAVKHRENSKLDAQAKQEGRMNMIEERKQKQLEKQKGEAQRKEKASGEVNANMSMLSDEERLLDKNGVVYSADSGTYYCGYCGWNIKKRPDVLVHIYSFEHLSCMPKQVR